MWVLCFSSTLARKISTQYLAWTMRTLETCQSGGKTISRRNLVCFSSYNYVNITSYYLLLILYNRLQFLDVGFKGNHLLFYFKCIVSFAIINVHVCTKAISNKIYYVLVFKLFNPTVFTQKAQYFLPNNFQTRYQWLLFATAVSVASHTE